MKQTIELTQEAIAGLFWDKLRTLGGKERNYTVNPADPTSVTVIKGEIGLIHGYTFNEDYPQPEVVKVKIANVCWGDEFTFETSMGTETAFFDKEWFRPTNNFFKVFTDLLLHGCEASEIRAMLEEEFVEVPDMNPMGV